MRFQSKSISAVLLASVVMAAPAAAQYPGKFGKSAAEIRVNYSIQVPLKDDNDETQAEAMEHGRKMLYEMSGRECGLILSTIARSCQLAGLSIQSNVRRTGVKVDSLHLSASATYRVELKGVDDGFDVPAPK